MKLCWRLPLLLAALISFACGCGEEGAGALDASEDAGLDGGADGSPEPVEVHSVAGVALGPGASARSKRVSSKGDAAQTAGGVGGGVDQPPKLPLATQQEVPKDLPVAGSLLGGDALRAIDEHLFRDALLESVASYGSLPGSFAVSPAGTATYDIPIVAPPGRGGLTPELSLHYASGAGNGLLGLGWSVNGLSSIALCSHTIAQDGALRDDALGFCLDGQRLIPVSFDSKVTTWRTEFDSFVRVVSPGDHFSRTDKPRVTPDHFVATTKSGRVMVYGGTDDATMQAEVTSVVDAQVSVLKTTRSWALTEVSDRAGNVMEITYSKLPVTTARPQVDAELLPRRIRYNLVNGVPLHEIVFKYQAEEADPPPSRPDRMLGFAYGMPVAVRHLLSRVEIHASGARVRGYALEHGATTNGLTVVRKVTECAYGPSGRARCRTPTEFDYEELAGGLGKGVDAPGVADQQWVALDWNSDGYGDAARYTGAEWKIHTGGPGGLSSGEDTLTPWREREATGVDGQLLSQAFATDFDANGRTDFLVETTTEDGILALERFEHGSKDRRFITLKGIAARKNASLVPFDLDGDGLQELLYCSGDSKPWWVFPNRGGALGEPRQVFGGSGGVCDDATVLNLPDGRQVVVSSHQNGSLKYFQVLGEPSWGGGQLRNVGLETVSVNPARHRIAGALDMNGDGLRDVLFVDRESDGYFWWLNTGTNANLAGLLTPGGSGRNMHLARARSVVAADFDLDGRNDILISSVTSASRSDWKLFPGAKLSDPPRVLAEFRGKVSAPLLLDANGDGRQDYLGNGRLYWGKTPAANLLKMIRIHTHPRDVPDRIEIAYATGVGGATYTPGRSGVDCDVPGTSAECSPQLPYPVVANYTRTAFRQDTRLSSPIVTQMAREAFAYFDLRIDRLGRGLIGLAKRVVTRTGVNGRETSTATETYDLTAKKEGRNGPFAAHDPSVGAAYNYYYYPYAWLPKTTYTTSALPQNELTGSSKGAVRTEIIANAFEVKSSDVGHRFVVNTSKEETLLELSKVVSQVRTVHSHDRYGNLKTSTTSWPSETGRTEEVAFEYAYERDPQRVAVWQVDLVAGMSRVSKAAVAGPGGQLGSVTQLAYDKRGLLQRRIEGAQEGASASKLVTEVGRDGWGNINLITQTPGAVGGASGGTPLAERVWSMAYDLTGVFITEKQNPEGHVETFETSHADGLPRTYRDPNGFVKRWKYDGFGRKVQERDESVGITTDIQFTRDSYSESGLVGENAVMTVTSITTANGSSDSLVSSYSVDTAGRTVAIHRQGFSAGTTVSEEFGYDVMGRLTMHGRPHLLGDRTQGVVTTRYDGLGRVTQERAADGRITETFYASVASVRPDLLSFVETAPAARWVTMVKRPDGSTRERLTNSRGKVVMSAEQTTTATKFELGASDFVLTVTDAAGNRATRTPDRFGRVERVTDPDTGEHSFAYDAWDEVVTQTQNGETHQFTYDGLGRMTSRTDRDGRTDWAWDAGGRVGALSKERSPTGHEVSYLYDGPGGALSEVSQRVIAGEGAIDLLTRLEYDAFVRPSVVHYPGERGFAVRYRYNGQGALVQVENADDPSERFWKLEAAYQGYRPERVSLGDQTTVATRFQPMNGWVDEHSVVSKSGESLLRESLEYDVSGRVSARRRMHDPAETAATSYEYDSLDRVTAVRSEAGAGAALLARFTYTPTGNIKTKSGIGTYSYSVPGESDTGRQTLPHAVRSTNGEAGPHTYQYNKFGRMVRREGASVPGQVQIFGYDAMGKLRSVETGPTRATTRFEYGPGGDRVHRVDPDGTSTIYAGAMYERQRAPNGRVTETLRVMVGDQAIAEVARVDHERTDTTYLHRDYLGSPELLTSSMGAVKERRVFGLFGEVRKLGELEPSSRQSALGFTGHRGEVELGLVDMVGRFYDPALGRFLTPDPTIPSPLFSQAYNRYSYVYNDPLNLVDPSGYEPEQTEHVDDGGSSCGPLCGPIGVLVVAVALPVIAVYWVGELFGVNWSAANPANWNWYKANPANWNWHKLNPGSWGRKSGGGSSSPERASGLRASAVRSGGVDQTPLAAAGDVGSGFVALGTIGLSMAPGVGEMMDLYVLTAPDSAAWERVAAAGSLGISAVSIGVTPNVGALSKVAGKALGEGTSAVGRGSARGGAESAANGVRLAKQLASEAGSAQLRAGAGKVMAGAGTKTPIRDAPRLVAEHSGQIGEWAKVTSSTHRIVDGVTVEVHGYMNVITREVFELKSKVGTWLP